MSALKLSIISLVFICSPAFAAALHNNTLISNTDTHRYAAPALGKINDLQVFSLKGFFSKTAALPPIAPAVPDAYQQTRSCKAKNAPTQVKAEVEPPTFITTRYYPAERKPNTANLTASSSLNSSISDNAKQALPALLDVVDIDNQIQKLEPLLLHYPIASMSGFAKFEAQNTITALLAQLTPYAKQANASTYVLYRAAKLHHFARNLDLGQSHQLLELDYTNRALALEPNDGELNFLYGTMIADSGGLVESLPFFEKALTAGLSLAYVSKANSLLLNEAPLDQVQACLYEYYLAEPQEPNTLKFQQRLDKKHAFLWRDDLTPQP